MKVKLIFLLSLIIFLVVGCNSSYKSLGYDGKKKSYYVEKVSLQSFNIDFYGKPELTEKEAENKWKEKAEELCNRTRMKVTITRNEVVQYIKAAHLARTSPASEFVCDYYGPLGCVIGDVLDGDSEITTVTSNSPGTHHTYRTVSGQLYCP